MTLLPHNFVDQTDVQAVAGAMAMLVAQPEQFIVSRSGFFSWDDVAARTDSVYNSIL